MAVKVCSTCKITRPVNEFSTDVSKKDGLQTKCKKCVAQYFLDHKDRLQVQQTNYYKTHREEQLANRKQHREAHKQEISKANKKYVLENIEKVRAYQKQWYQNNKDWVNTYTKERRKTDPLFKLVCSLRIRLWVVLTQGQTVKTSNMGRYLGCTLEELKTYLEKQFKPGMTWDNHTKEGWHVDHILPLIPEESISEEEIYKRCHYTNLQPLWATENLQKSNRI